MTTGRINQVTHVVKGNNEKHTPHTQPLFCSCLRLSLSQKERSG